MCIHAAPDEALHDLHRVGRPVARVLVSCMLSMISVCCETVRLLICLIY